MLVGVLALRPPSRSLLSSSPLLLLVCACRANPGPIRVPRRRLSVGRGSYAAARRGRPTTRCMLLLLRYEVAEIVACVGRGVGRPVRHVDCVPSLLLLLLLLLLLHLVHVNIIFALAVGIILETLGWDLVAVGELVTDELMLGVLVELCLGVRHSIIYVVVIGHWLRDIRNVSSL